MCSSRRQKSPRQNDSQIVKIYSALGKSFFLKTYSAPKGLKYRRIRVDMIEVTKYSQIDEGDLTTTE